MIHTEVKDLGVGINGTICETLKFSRLPKVGLDQVENRLEFKLYGRGLIHC